MDAHLLVAFAEFSAIAVAVERRRAHLVIVGEAVAGKEPVVAAEVVIDPDVERMRVVGVRPVHHVVVVQPGDIRFRVELHQPYGIGVETASWNPVAGERIPHEAALGGDHTRHRIDLARLHLSRRGRIEHRPARINPAQGIGSDVSALQRDEIREIGEPAGSLQRRGHRSHPGPRLIDQAALVVGEPERLGADRRPASREAELIREVVAFLEAGAVGEEVARIQRVVAMELPDGAAQLTGARLQRGVHDRPAGAAVFGAERAGENLDLVDRVDRRLDDVGDAAEEVDVAGVVVDAVEQVVVLRRPHAVGREHQRRARAGLRRHDAGDQPGEHRVVAPVDRQVLDRVGFQRLADRAAAGLQQRRLRGHDDLIGQAARLQRDIDQRLLLNADRDAAAHRFLEALELDFDRVGAGADGREDVGAVLTRHRSEHEGLAFMGDGDSRAGKNTSTGIFHRPEDRSRVDLRARAGGEQQRHAEDQPEVPAQESLDAHLSSLRGIVRRCARSGDEGRRPRLGAVLGAAIQRPERNAEGWKGQSAPNSQRVSSCAKPLPLDDWI